MDFVQKAISKINLQEDSLYDFLYNMVLFIGLEKGKKELESENYHSLEEFEKFITELGVKNETENI